MEDIVNNHKYLKSYTEAAAMSLKAGNNMQVAPWLAKAGSCVFDRTVNATMQGLITVKEVRDSVKHLFYARMRLGEFDPPSMNPYSKIGTDVIQSEEHRQIALQAAKMSLVLLKNDNQLLPLKSKLDTVAVSSFSIPFI